jgi:hypothetical protein
MPTGNRSPSMRRKLAIRRSCGGSPPEVAATKPRVECLRPPAAPRSRPPARPFQPLLC